MDNILSDRGHHLAPRFTASWTDRRCRRLVQPVSRGLVGCNLRCLRTWGLDPLRWRFGDAASRRQLLHRCDQGSQYSSEDFQRVLSAEGITCSMSRRGDCWDNSAVESFFASLKKKRVHRKTFPTRATRTRGYL